MSMLLLLLLLSCFSRVRLCAAHQASRPWDSPGKNTGVGCHFLLQCMKVKSACEVVQSCLTLATPWTAAYQGPPSMGFSRQKYWSGVPLPSPKNVYQIRSDQLLSRVRLLSTPWIAARQASLSNTNSRSSLRLTSIKSMMPSRHLILCHPDRKSTRLNSSH